MNNVFVIAHPRSGSTYLCGLLHAFRDFKVYFEIFHSDINVIKRHLHGDYDVVNELFNPGTGALTKEQVVQDTNKYIQSLADENVEKRLVCKIFPGHLPLEQLQMCLLTTEVVVILQRNLLHSFISDCIATEVQRWAGLDTSGKKIEFSPLDFISHVKRVTNFYNATKKFSKNKKVIDINYEKLISAEEPLVEIQNIFNSVGLSTELMENQEKKVTLQDKRYLASEKVTNPDELMHFLCTNGLNILNDSKNIPPKNIYSKLL